MTNMVLLGTFGLEHRIFVLSASVHVVDEIGAIKIIVDFLPSVGQFVVQAVLERTLLKFGEARIQPVGSTRVMAEKIILFN